jgi:hypothetical protein
VGCLTQSQCAESAVTVIVTVTGWRLALPKLREAAVLLQGLRQLGSPLGCDLILDQPER